MGIREDEISQVEKMLKHKETIINNFGFVGTDTINAISNIIPIYKECREEINKLNRFIELVGLKNQYKKYKQQGESWAKIKE